MNSTELEKIIETNKLPKDELDSFWENLLWYFLMILALGISILRLSLETVSNIDFLFFIITITLSIYTVWSSINERNLSKVYSDLHLSDSRKMIEHFAENPKWILQKSKKSYWEFTVATIFKIPTHKLVIITLEKEILFNFRNIGSFRGRAPFSFGMDTYHEFMFKRKVKNYVQQRI